MSYFTYFQNVFCAIRICILKSFNSHISVVICSFFEFGTGSKWCIGEWVNCYFQHHFQHYFNYIAMINEPIHAFLEFFILALRTIFFPSHRLLSHINIIKTTDSIERGRNPVAMAIISPKKECFPS